MCWEGKCFGCIPVEHACLVIAVISAVSTGLGLLACLILGILIVGGVAFGHEAARQALPWESAAAESAVTAAGTIAGIIALVVGVACLIAFIFSVQLCNGICKRRPGQVKAYFIYGVTITVMAVLAASIELIRGPTEVGVSALLGCAVYSLFLVLVYQTYLKMLMGVVFQDHVRLMDADGHTVHHHVQPKQEPVAINHGTSI